jgi:GNAT superfamily N-acetyltransferase/N-acetylglutamate synthase-like GNAT family acetyltransferase
VDAVITVLDGFTIEPFSNENVAEVHEFFEAHASQGLYSFSIETFKRVTINDKDFHPDLSIVARTEPGGEIVAAFLLIVRKASITVKSHPVTLKMPVLTFFAVQEGARRKGIGSKVLQELLARRNRSRDQVGGKKRGITIALRKVAVMAAPPNYIWPGLDPRYTPAYFFLKTNGFKHYGERQNLGFAISDDMQEPHRECNGMTITRATHEDLDATVQFVGKTFTGFWSEEIQLAFKNDPVSAFIAKDSSGKIVGFAGHSIQFPGSFGPTGVLKTLRGKGLGGVLLKWCAHDLKNAGMNKMIIMWVEGDTMKFYSKSIGARVDQVFWTMQK